MVIQLGDSIMKSYILLQGNPTFYLVSAIVMVCFCITIMIVFILSKLEYDKRITNSAIELNKITNSIHAGLVHFESSDKCSIYYASKGFYHILDYTKDEAREQCKASILDFVHSEEKDFFMKSIKDLNKACTSFEVRMVKKDGSIIYCLMNGNYVTGKDGSQSVSAVFVDITKQKKMQEMLRLDRERYRVAADLSNDVLFEYYIKTDQMILSDKYLELFGRSPVIFDYVKECYMRRDFIHPNDYGIYLEFCSELSAGAEMLSAECRWKDRHNNYIWCQIMGKTIYDEEDKPSRVIGKIVNVDYHKKELDSLEYKATRDPLTGVYNREMTIKKVENYINGNKNGVHALIFIDFDDFKKVNDNYGHLVGDRVLIHIIKNIRSVFTEGEIIGRVGGDEFVVFIGYANDNETIMNKADELINALGTPYIDNSNGTEIAISGSAGIATYPGEGSYYEQLIQCADKALYCVKSKGKNNYMFYNSSM